MAFRIRLENGVVQPQALDPNESFVGPDGPLAAVTVGDYWQWACSDILGNTERGALAEFIVARAIRSQARTRNAWASWDLLTPTGLRVEVKSAAYVQTWYQAELSRIQFNIRKTLEWHPEKNQFSGPPKRHSDVYVFCLLAERDKERVNPLDLSQWEFYVVETAMIDALFEESQGIGLKRVQELSPAWTIQELADAIEGAVAEK